MPVQATPPAWLQPLVQLIATTVVMGGWFFVSRDNNKREDRKYLRSTIDSIISDIKSLEQKAYSYYTSSNEEASKNLIPTEIKRDIDMLDFRLGLLKSTYSRANKWWYKRKIFPLFQDLEKRSQYRRNLTGGDFEQANREKCEASNRKLLEISYAAKELISELEAQYATLYPNQ